MTERDRTKLVRLLGLLSSNHIGERAAAAFQASRHMTSLGLAWDEVITPADADLAKSAAEARLIALQACKRHADHLTEWERNFLSGIAARSTLSQRQLAVLQKIAGELASRAAGCAR